MTQGLRRILQALLHIEDTPHRTALAFGVGVLIAFSPFLGIHMGIALLVAFLFRLNRVAILLGTYLNNPWTLAPIYLAGTSLGCLLLGISRDGLDTIDWELTGWAFLQGLWTTLRRYVWPFLLGNTILGVACGLVGYFLLRRFLERRAAHAAQAAPGA
ncbi:MAG TPA: DUF2062 domain-containing protein [Vicinamibacteria bacterium]|nr:DUF2062 domain-containing protein [Vicinamibacteria bacterium]